MAVWPGVVRNLASLCSINQQNTGRCLPVLITVLEANGFPACRSLKVLKELNDPQGTKAGRPRLLRRCFYD